MVGVAVIEGRVIGVDEVMGIGDHVGVGCTPDANVEVGRDVRIVGDWIIVACGSVDGVFEELLPHEQTSNMIKTERNAETLTPTSHTGKILCTPTLLVSGNNIILFQMDLYFTSMR